MKKIFIWILGVTILLIGIALAVTKADTGAWVLTILLGVLFIICATIITFRPAKKKSGKIVNQKKIKPSISFVGTSLYGLPQGETKCKIEVYKDYISFVTGKQISKLSMEKVSSAYLKTKKELEGAKTGSIVAGAVFFGAIGAIVSSRARRNDSYILIINYSDKDESKAIAVSMEKYLKYEGEKAEKYINKRASKYQSECEVQL